MKFVRLKDKKNRPATAITESKSVIMEDGSTLEQGFANLNSKVESLVSNMFSVVNGELCQIINE